MSKIDQLKDIMVKLRDPDGGCPWDVEQDYSTIAPHTIEEAYEVADAIAKKDMQGLKDELGDLLFQVIFHSQMASEEGLFNFEDVIESIIAKMIARHPHVFGEDSSIKNAKDQEEAWEKHKQKERDQKDSENKGALAGVAIALPALTRAAKLQKRAAKVGFDWPSMQPVYQKVEEELSELKEVVDSNDQQAQAEEMGDLLFAVVNISRKLGLDPETVLRGCNDKFVRRFEYIEKEAGKPLQQMTLEEMDLLWEEAKNHK